VAHDIDITNGIASFASAHQDAWHSLGTVLDHGMTAEDAMVEAHLGGWNVRKSPLFTEEGGRKIEVPGRNAVLRTNPITGRAEALAGGVGDGYSIVQNEEHAELLNTIVAESGAHFETAGALDGGKRVFITMALPGEIRVGGVDPIRNYLAMVNSHDGSMALTSMVTPVRIVCANTCNFALDSASQIFRVRHTSGAQRNMVTEARRMLDLSFGYLEEFKATANRLIDTDLTQLRFEEIINREFGAAEDASKAVVTRSDKRLEVMSELFADAITQEGIRGTAWAGLNALTEWNDHFAPTRGDDRDVSRATKAIMDPAFKNKALALMMAV
jgi:phage/plasmid-like protein (TIGR03299 family)